MELILALLLGGGCVAVGGWALRRRRRRRQPVVSEESLGRGLDDLRPDDVLTHDGGDWMVSGVAQLMEAGVTWIECRLEDASREGWIVVHPGDADAALVGERVADFAVAGDRPSDSLDHQGKVFRLERFGRATVEVTGELDGRYGQGECGYWNYRRPGDGRVWFRQSGESWSYFSGRRVPRHLIGFLPGS